MILSLLLKPSISMSIWVSMALLDSSAPERCLLLAMESISSTNSTQGWFFLAMLKTLASLRSVSPGRADTRFDAFIR